MKVDTALLPYVAKFGADMIHIISTTPRENIDVKHVDTMLTLCWRPYLAD